MRNTSQLSCVRCDGGRATTRRTVSIELVWWSLADHATTVLSWNLSRVTQDETIRVDDMDSIGRGRKKRGWNLSQLVDVLEVVMCSTSAQADGPLGERRLVPGSGMEHALTSHSVSCRPWQTCVSDFGTKV